MPASRNSKTSPISSWLGAAGVLLAFAGLGAAAAAWCSAQGYQLYYGDAQAHLNIARRLFDTRTPTYEQIGTVWLPLPHLAWMPFVKTDEWWRTGLAGAFPGVAAYALSALAMFLLVRRLTESSAAALASAAVLSLNPNLLYLQSTAMTEPLSLSLTLLALWLSVEGAGRKSARWAAAAGVAASLACLTRYDAWFLLPIFCLYLLAAGGLRMAIVFGAVASLAPIYWLAHNWWCYGDALEFYRGPWSAKAIYERSLKGGMARYPGDRDWWVAGKYYLAAARWTIGWPGLVLAAGSAASLVNKRMTGPWLILAALPAFYVLSMTSAGTPIFVPDLWPFTYYNTRYGLALLPLGALGAGALAALLPVRLRGGMAAAAALIAIAPWLWQPIPESWICWKESQMNSRARREWTGRAAKYLAAHYRGGGIAASFGDLTGIFQSARIPLRETLHEGNIPQWEGVVARPDLFLREEWIVTMSGDTLSSVIYRALKDGPYYDCEKRIEVTGAPVIEIWRRGAQAKVISAEEPKTP
jgi:hypothetical protein